MRATSVSNYQEAFRNLYHKGLRFLNSDRTVNRWPVSSFGALGGKEFADCAAGQNPGVKTGQRVLLIDADYANPRCITGSD